MSENPYQPVPADQRSTRSPWLLAMIIALVLCNLVAFLAGYLVGHAAGFWDAERLQIGDEASGLNPGELP